MRIMIHACPARMWYVNEFLIPSLKEQGADDIYVWNDRNGLGNLEATMASFALCGHYSGGTWHLQDDVIIAHDFVERARAHDEGVVCGYVNQQAGPNVGMTGRRPVCFHWWSFPCIRIPNEYARACAEWWRNEGRYKDIYQSHIYYKNGDDTVFRDWLVDISNCSHITNLTPNLVDHIDYLLGGSVTNKHREYTARAFYFEDKHLVDALAEQLATRASNAV